MIVPNGHAVPVWCGARIPAECLLVTLCIDHRLHGAFGRHEPQQDKCQITGRHDQAGSRRVGLGGFFGGGLPCPVTLPAENQARKRSPGPPEKEGIIRQVVTHWRIVSVCCSLVDECQRQRPKRGSSISLSHFWRHPVNQNKTRTKG
jgi:hypothetical protein